MEREKANLIAKDSNIYDEFASIMKNVPDGIVKAHIRDGKCELIFASERVATMLGYTLEELKKRMAEDITFEVHPDDVKKTSSHIAMSMKESGYFECRYRVIHKDGSVSPVEACTNVVVQDDGVKILYSTIYGIEREIATERALQMKEEAMTAALKENEQLIKIIAKHSQKYLIRYDYATDTIEPLGNHINVESSVMKVLKSPKDYFTGGILAPESLDEVKRGYEAMKGGAFDVEVHFKTKNLNDEWIWMECIMSNVFDDNGKPAYIIASFEDVTDIHEKKLAFERYKKIMYAEDTKKSFFFDYNLTQDTLEADSGNVDIPGVMKEARKGYMHFIRMAARDLVVEDDRQSFLETFDESRMLQAFAAGSDRGEIDVQIKLEGDEEPTYVKASYQLVKEPYNAGTRLLFHCEIIDEKKRAELEVMHRARMDDLTQIYNRLTFMEEVKKRIASADTKKVNAFALLDIDHFKNINDTLGHITGDQILYKVAKSLKKGLFQRDIVGRFGGDEFGVFICGLPDSDAVKEKLEEILDNIREDLGNGIKLSASIGVALLSDECSTFHDLYEKSDKALYYVKENGRDGYKIYEE